MRVLLVEPQRPPKEIDLAPGLKSLQTAVGGPIQAVYPFDEPIALVCHEEAKLLGLPLNRALYHPETHELYDIIAGAFFLCAAPPESEAFQSLSEAQLQKYSTIFAIPECFIRLNGCLCVLPLGEEAVQ